MYAFNGLFSRVHNSHHFELIFFQSLAEALKVPAPKFLPRWTARLLGSLGETLSRSQRISNARFREAAAWSPIYPSVRDAWGAIVV